jgi:V8-like Glu-specific endopeptidase
VTVLTTADPLDSRIAALPIAKWPPHKRPGKTYIVGHPLGQVIAFSFDNNKVEHLENDQSDGSPVRIYYGTPTARGNSGSPVFNERWEIIGVHHVGNARVDTADPSKPIIANEGVLMSSVNVAIHKNWRP